MGYVALSMNVWNVYPLHGEENSFHVVNAIIASDILVGNIQRHRIQVLAWEAANPGLDSISSHP